MPTNKHQHLCLAVANPFWLQLHHSTAAAFTMSFPQTPKVAMQSQPRRHYIIYTSCQPRGMQGLCVATFALRICMQILTSSGIILHSAFPVIFSSQRKEDCIPGQQ
jgi:hypothetical protein